MSASNIWIAIGIISGAIAAFSLPYGFYLKSHEKKVGTVAKQPQIVVEKMEKSGDIIGRDKITYNQQTVTPSQKDAGEEIEKKLKLAKIKITRFLEDYKLNIEGLREEYFKESNRIASNMNSRGVLSSGIHIKAQMDHAIETKKKVDDLFVHLDRNIEDILLEGFDTNLLSQVPGFQEEYSGYNSLKETNKKLYKAMEENVKSWEVKINGSVSITKDFILK